MPAWRLCFFQNPERCPDNFPLHSIIVRNPAAIASGKVLLTAATARLSKRRLRMGAEDATVPDKLNN